MGAIQGSINSMINTAGVAIGVGKSLGKKPQDSQQAKSESQIDVDLKMAQKARKMAQAKINAIYQNKEISKKAMTRRVGKVLDELKEDKK